MRPATSKLVTDSCPAVQTVLPLYLENDHFVTPYCCMGNNADCDRCATWVVFAHAARIEGPWDKILHPSKEHDSFEAGYRIGS